MEEWWLSNQEEQKTLKTAFVEQMATLNCETDTLAVTLGAFKQGFVGKEDLKVLTSMIFKVSVVERRRTILKHAHTSSEEKLCAFLKYSSELEMKALIERALREGLISSEVFNHFSSLDSEVPTSMRCRYLLQSVFQSLNRSLENFKKRALVVVPYQLDSEFDPLDVARNAERDGLIERHVLDYLVSLNPVLPRMLKLFSICKQMVVHSVEEKVLQLRHLAYEYLPLKNPFYTMSRETEIMGSGYLAEMKSYFQTALNCPSKHGSVYIKEGLSTLLEIQPCEEEKTYQWMKDGIEIHRDSSTKPIFCLPQADIDWDGCELSCQVKPMGKTAAPIITVNVSCILDLFRSALASIYLAQPEVPEDTWPPVANRKYINLALVRQRKLNYNSEYARLTIRGDMDDVLHDKQIIEYCDKDFYQNLRSGKLVLIEGRPGSGKTTFVHKLARDWAVNFGGAIRLLLLVSLRVLNTFSSPDLSDILMLFKDLQASKDAIEQRLGKGVCFIFDGFDEFSPQDGQSSVVYKIINKTYLRHSIVIVASRPKAIAKLRGRADAVLEVVGFTNEQILEYFDLYPFLSTIKSAELKSYLTLHPNIFHMCYLPIHATLIAFLYEALGEVPRTETEIYTHFTNFTLVRNLTKNREFEPVGIRLHNLTGEVGASFNQICLLAFKMTLSGEQVLDQNEVTAHFGVERSIDSSLGLITVDRTAGLYGYKNIYTFMHLTFQEYLAAYHITTLSDEEQMKLIQEHGAKNHMLVVWKFYCGLTKIKVFDNKFKSILCKTEGNILFQIQCGFETQQKIACAQLLKSVNYHLKLEDKYLSTPDFTALGYVTNTTVIPTKLSLLNCNINVDAIDALLSEMEDKARDSIYALHILTATFDGAQMECMKKLLTNLKSLKAVSLEVEFVHHTEKELVKSNKLLLPGLTKLFVVNVDIMFLLNSSSFAKLSNLRLKGQFQVLNNYMQHCKHLKELDISGSNIDNADAKVLARSLKGCISLERINIAETCVQTSGVAAICKSLQHCYMKVDATTEMPNNIREFELLLCLAEITNLRSLKVSIYINSIYVLCKCTQNWKHIKELDVSLQELPDPLDLSLSDLTLNLIGPSKELVALTIKNYSSSHALAWDILLNLEQCPNIQKLDLSNIGVNSSLMKKIILRLSNLEELQMYFSQVGDHVELLSSGLKHFPCLLKLSLPRNNITNSGCHALAASLHYCTNLEELDLEDNKIDNDGALAIISGLKNCKHFQKLNLCRNSCCLVKTDSAVTFSVLPQL